MTEEHTAEIHQLTTERLAGTGGVFRINKPYQGEIPPPSEKESIWRIFDTKNNNRIIVTQMGEQVLKKKSALSTESMESLAHLLHKVVSEGRQLTEEDPFEYIFGISPSRELVGSGGEGVVYRIKGTNIAMKIRMNRTMSPERNLEALEAMRMAVELRHKQGLNLDVDVAPVLFVIFPKEISEENTEAKFPDTENEVFDCVFMEYIEGEDPFEKINNAESEEEKTRLKQEYDERVEEMKSIGRMVSKSIYLRDEAGDPILDLSIQNVKVVGKRYIFFDYAVK